MSTTKPPILSEAEQAQRRLAIEYALVQVRLEKLEPHPAAFALAERYIHGEITIDEALAALAKQVSSLQ